MPRLYLLDLALWMAIRRCKSIIIEVDVTDIGQEQRMCLYYNERIG